MESDATKGRLTTGHRVDEPEEEVRASTPVSKPPFSPSSEAFSALFVLLETRCGWPTGGLTADDLTYTYRARDLNLTAPEFMSIRWFGVMRALPGQSWRVVLMDFGIAPFLRWPLRRVLYQLTLRRPLHRIPRAELSKVLFVCRSQGDVFTFGHFSGTSPHTATLAVFDTHGVLDQQRPSSRLDTLRWDHQDEWRKAWEESEYRFYRRRQDRSRHSIAYFEAHSPALGDLARRARAEPILTIREEKTLIARALSGSARAEEELLWAHMDRIIETAARWWDRYPDYGVPLEDMVSCGIEGFLKALRTFDTQRAQVVVHNWNWVVRNVSRALLNFRYPVRIPAYVYERPIDDVDLKVRQMVDSQEVISDFDLDIVAAPKLFPLEHDVNDIMGILNGCLNDRQCAVVLLRTGLHPDYPGIELTFDQVAGFLGVTRERARQIESRAYAKIASREAAVVEPVDTDKFPLSKEQVKPKVRPRIWWPD